MKTRKTILTIALLLLAAFTAFAQQYNPESDFEVEVIDNGRAVRITGYNGNNTVVNIPPRIRNLPVTEIGRNVFREKGLTGVSIPDSVIIIGEAAFMSNQLITLTIPNNVTTIGQNAFARNQLTSITIPNTVVEIAGSAFRNNQLTSVTIPNSVTTIGEWAFRMNMLTSVTIGNRVETIGRYAFAGNQLTSVSIPANVTVAGDAFDGGIVELYSQRGRRAFHFEQGLGFNVTLPANNPRQADLLLGAAVFQELQVLRFLGDTDAVSRHEEVLRFITGRGNATRAEVEAFYRNGIRALVSDIVDEQYARLRAGRQNFNVPAARLVEVKQAITNFMLNPSTASYAELLATYRRNAGEAALVLGFAMVQINNEIASALLVDNRVLISP